MANILSTDKKTAIISALAVGSGSSQSSHHSGVEKP